METLKELVNRDMNEPVDVHEMEFVVGEYIRARKKVNVLVDICKGIRFPMSVFDQEKYMMQVQLLNHAYLKALVWFRENPHLL